MDLEEWAKSLAVTPGFEDAGKEVLSLIDDCDAHSQTVDALRMAMTMQGVETATGDPVAILECVMERYAFVRDTFNVREEFDLGDDGYMPKMLGVLVQGDRALSFKWKVVGILRKAGAVGEDAVKLPDETLLSILEMMMP